MYVDQNALRNAEVVLTRVPKIAEDALNHVHQNVMMDAWLRALVSVLTLVLEHVRHNVMVLALDNLSVKPHLINKARIIH